MDFVTMVSGSLGKQGKWVPRKHMYYVLQHVMFCGQFESFIHFPTWSCNEAYHLLARSLASTQVRIIISNDTKMYYPTWILYISSLALQWKGNYFK
jgi:hypothetical protein